MGSMTDEILMVVAILFLVSLALNIVLLGRMRKARKQSFMKLAMLRNMSNEMRSPLNLVSSLAETIGDETLYLSKTEKRMISEQVKSSMSLVGTLLDDLIVFCDDGFGSQRTKNTYKQNISPNILCRRCVDYLDGSRKEKTVRLSFKRELSDDFTMYTDPRVIEIILSKLLFNSLRFTEKGEIVVGCSLKERHNMLSIYVQDTGVGIPGDRKADIFSWFEKPEYMRDEAELDLSIAQKLAFRLGGFIELDENYHEGTRLKCFIPIS